MSPVPDPGSMRRLLSGAFGEGRTIRKNRLVLLVGQSRLHFDDVEGLGKFIEIEVCLKPGQDRREGVSIAQELRTCLGIEDTDLLEGAYVEMLDTRP